MEQKKYTITVFAENKPGVLYRIADLFLRRKINLESLTVSKIEDEPFSRFTIVVIENVFVVEKVVKQLYRIIEVVKVFDNSDDNLLFKEITFIKVKTKSSKERSELKEIAEISGAKIIHITTDSVVIEKTGSEEEVRSLYSLVKPFGVKEFIRSGRIAIVKN